MDKKQLREHFRSIRMAVDYDKDWREWDELITRRFLDTEEYRRCEQLLCYVSGEIEVGTACIIQDALDRGKTVLVPRCVKGANIMHFYRLRDWDDLSTGMYGIQEPSEHCERYDKFENAVCVVPALSFDLKGFRLGFGKGFYDRFLAAHDITKVGLCFENCISDALPADEYDISVNKIITEKRTINVKKG